ncbi:MAG: type II toxin-antitoxin system Phd/YefM family antitoxin [Mycobacteriales bacterium]
MEVGVRDFKNQLGHYLALVRQGDEIVVTYHGRAVAKITPIGRERTIDRLVAEGLVMPALSAKAPAPGKQVRATEPVSSLVAEQRQ